MSKPYSEAEFSEQIAHDRNWRLKELSDMKSAIVRADAGTKRVLLRSLVAICYAHWEGSVRNSAVKYLEHVALRKFQYGNLERQFLKNYFIPRLAALSSSKFSIADRCALIDDILSAGDRRFSRVNGDLVNTRSNLNFEVFSDICLVCGVPIDAFRQHQAFIDVVLLKRRNSIAHGEETFVDVSDLDELATNTIALMRGFGDALENKVYLRGYAMA